MMTKKLKTLAYKALFILALYIPTALVFYFALTKHFAPTDRLAHLRLVILLLFAPIILKYVIHLFIAPWYPLVESWRSKKRAASGYWPSVSILIPAHNEEVGIAATMQSVLDTNYPNLELIVVNNGSTDGTHREVMRFIAGYKKIPRKFPAFIKYGRLIGAGKAQALNRGLFKARGEIIATIDADSIMDKRALKNLVKHFSHPQVAAVAGNVVIGNRKKSIGLIQQLEYLYGFYFKRADALLNAVYIVGGAAAAYNKQVIVDLGGFDETIITEDIELSTRLQDHGYHVRYATDAIVYTEGPSDFLGLRRQRLRWKYGRLLTFYKYRHLFFSFKRRHNFYLSFLILPIALFAELLLFFEGILLAIFYVYTYYTNDYWPLAFVLLLLAGVICLQILSDPNTRYHKNLFWLAPGAWIIFYIMDFVEYQALMASLWRIIRKHRLSWQSWTRLGVFENSTE